MAISTVNDRRSAAPQVTWLMLPPLADGGIGGLDRRHLAGLYILGTPPSGAGFIDTIEVIAEFSDQTLEVRLI